MAELTETTFEALPDNLVELAVFPSYSEAFERALVLLAMGRDCWLLSSPLGYRLLVEPIDMPEINRQLSCYDRERIGWPPPPHQLEADPPAYGGPVLWALALVFVFWATAFDPSLVQIGELDRTAVLGRGEWWRIASALFLHADTAHLVANAVAGVFAFSSLLGIWGRVWGWLLLSASALLGNTVSTLLHTQEAYRSIGSSTAVFAAIGLLTGNAVRSRLAHAGANRPAFFPLAVGCVLLALYGGSGDAHVDVLAHASGFGCGLFLGLIARSKKPAVSPTVQ